MGIILDIVILAILILSIVMGYKKGLIGVVFSLCALIVAIIVTIILYNPITNLVIKNTQIDDNIKNAIIENGIIEKSESEDKDEKKQLNEYIQKYVTDGVTDATNNAIEKTAGVVAEKVVSVGVAICLFVVVRIALILLKFIAEGIAELPIIKQCNKAGGIAYGVLRGMIVIYGLLALAFFILSLTNSQTIGNTIDSSIVTKFLYTHNIFLR